MFVRKDPIEKAVVILSHVPEDESGSLDRLNQLVKNGCSGCLLIDKHDRNSHSLDIFLHFINSLLDVIYEYSDIPNDKNITTIRNDIKELNDRLVIVTDINELTVLPCLTIRNDTHSTDLMQHFADFIEDKSRKILILAFEQSLPSSTTFLLDEITSRHNILTCFISPIPKTEKVSLTPRLLPQSYEFKNGNKVDVDTDNLFVFTYHSLYATRIDDISSFDYHKMVNEGGNGVILAYHALSEIAYILDMRDKYGA